MVFINSDFLIRPYKLQPANDTSIFSASWSRDGLQFRNSEAYLQSLPVRKAIQGHHETTFGLEYDSIQNFQLELMADITVTDLADLAFDIDQPSSKRLALGAAASEFGQAGRQDFASLLDVSESAFTIHYFLNPSNLRIVHLTINFFAASYLGLSFLRVVL